MSIVWPSHLVVLSLAFTTRRKLYASHNPSRNDKIHSLRNGVLFDVLQCLIQRNFNYATRDVRDCYITVKDTLYNPSLTKVIFILHSQGGIEGGMIVDWLLQEVPQDLLARLEIYTFGNASNHFNNPHQHLLSQRAALVHPTIPTITKTRTSVHYHDPLPHLNTAITSNQQTEQNGVGKNAQQSTSQSSTSGKTIRYIEHYAHTSDFVARWGVLHFTCNFSSSPNAPRFMGRVFERQGEGHQFNMHYLDGMFPLKPCATSQTKRGVGGSGFDGADEDVRNTFELSLTWTNFSQNNKFMNSILSLTHSGDECTDEREGLEMSYLGAHGEPLSRGEKEVLLRDMSPISPQTLELMNGNFANGNGGKELDGGNRWDMKRNGDVEVKEDRMDFKVKDLSRLWLYVNGKSPKSDQIDIGIARMATL